MSEYNGNKVTGSIDRAFELLFRENSDRVYFKSDVSINFLFIFVNSGDIRVRGWSAKLYPKQMQQGQFYKLEKEF